MKLPALSKKKKKPKGEGLYGILGVSKDATFEEIKEAFLERAKKLHPDKGGDEDAFVILLNAYRVLRDPEKRQIYDDFGEVDDLVSNDYAHMIDLLANLFKQALETELPDRPDVSLVDAIKVAISREIEDADKEEKKLSAQVQKFNDLKERIKRTDEKRNLFGKILDEKINKLLKSENSLGAKKRVLILASKEIEHYVCITEVIDIVKYYTFTTSSSTSSSGINTGAT